MAKRKNTVKITQALWDRLKEQFPDMLQYYELNEPDHPIPPELEVYLQIDRKTDEYRYWQTLEAFRARIESLCDGMSIDEYTELLKLQDGRCGICRRMPTWTLATWKRFQVDHDHKTSEVRGLLCSHCNAGLGQFRDKQDSLIAAVAYLQNPPAQKLHRVFYYTKNTLSGPRKPRKKAEVLPPTETL